MTATKVVWAQCRKCAKSTRHEILYSHQVASDPDDYPDEETWQVVRCQGCYNVGFRYRYDDYAAVYETEYGSYTHEHSISTYPKAIPNHKDLDSVYLLPDVIRNVYKQTLSACSEEAYVLASIGLRATIEATCNHLDISGRSLERRIDLLYKAGYVSNSDKKRLHAIRFLGNDAAHEIIEPQKSELLVALEIVEHLLNSVFILESKAKKLETIIESYDEFIETLRGCAKGKTSGEVLGIANLLGRKKRLVAQNLPHFEAKLINDISSGNIPFLNLGKVEKIDERDIQLYVIA